MSTDKSAKIKKKFYIMCKLNITIYYWIPYDFCIPLPTVVFNSDITPKYLSCILLYFSCWCKHTEKNKLIIACNNIISVKNTRGQI